MSLIIAIKDKEKKITYVGADSRVSGGLDYTEGNIAKILYPSQHQGEMVFGAVGYLRTINILATQDQWLDDYELHRINTGKEKVDDVFVTRNIVPKLFSMFEHYGFLKVNEGIKSIPNSTISFIYKDIIAEIGALGSVLIYDDFYASGCAEDYAYGSLEQTVGIEDPVERIALAMEAAYKHNTGVGGDILILEVHHDGIPKVEEPEKKDKKNKKKS